MKQNFIFDSKAKTISLALVLIGLVLIALGYFTGHGHEQSRFWSSLLYNNLFVTWIALIGGFFVDIKKVISGDGK